MSLTLNISGAALKTFPEIRDRLYENIDASWNSIGILWEEEIPETTKVLNLEGNRLVADGLLQVWPNSIHTLNLSKNCITDLRDVNWWPNSLRVLNISSNAIAGVVNFGVFPPSLEELEISSTDITSIVEFPQNLKVFTAISTALQRLPSRCPDSLTKCTVSYATKMRKNGLPNYWGASLEYLELHNSRVHEFPRNLPASLKLLNLSKNRIGAICSLAQFPPNLQTLHLGDNRIMELPNWFQKFPKMFYTIQNNLLTEIPTTPNCLIAVPQLVGPKFQSSVQRIQRCWRSYKMRSPFRTWYRISVLKNELLALAMCPERAGRFEDVSPEWGIIYEEPLVPSRFA
jgi:Leucine-rich repeat (LRR) protein